MAIIKIVPMPGVEVPGPQGPAGPQGPQGLQGPAGQDASSFISSGTWDTQFMSLSDLTGTYENNSMRMGRYYRIGDLVFFEYQTISSSVEDWGSSLGWHFKLPFAPAEPWQSGLNEFITRDMSVGRIFGNTDLNGLPDPDEFGWIPLYGVISKHQSHGGVVYLYAEDVQDIHTKYDSIKPVNSSWPWNFAEAENHRFRFHITGTYRAEAQ